MIHNKTLPAWYQSHPVLETMVALRETQWFNPSVAPTAQALGDVGLTAQDVAAASARLRRFGPYLASVFPRRPRLAGSSNLAWCQSSRCVDTY